MISNVYIWSYAVPTVPAGRVPTLYSRETFIFLCWNNEVIFKMYEQDCKILFEPVKDAIQTSPEF